MDKGKRLAVRSGKGMEMEGGGAKGQGRKGGPAERRRNGEKKGVVVAEVVVVSFGDTSPLISGSACLSPQLSRPHGTRHSVFPSKFQLDA